MPLSNIGRAAITIPTSVGLGVLLQKYYLNELGLYGDKHAVDMQQQKYQQQNQHALEMKLIDELISMNKKVGQLESNLEHLHQITQSQQLKMNTMSQEAVTRTQPQINVFELSKVIEANDLASANKHRKELEEVRKNLMRENMVKTEGAVARVEHKYKPILSKVKELETHLETQQKALEKEAPSRLLWIACQGLFERLRNDTKTQPLENDPSFNLVKKFAMEDNNPLAKTVISTIPPIALKEGVCSEEVLVKRFANVSRVCKRVALIDAKGGGIGTYLVSYLQSLFILNREYSLQDEISGEKLVDPTSWTTYDILARVNKCLEERNLELAVRYANQLKGQARLVAKDWIRDARACLETKQALATISDYARGLSFVPAQMMHSQFAL